MTENRATSSSTMTANMLTSKVDGMKLSNNNENNPILTTRGRGRLLNTFKPQPIKKPDEEMPAEEDKITDAERSLLQKVVRKGLVTSKYDIEVKRKDPTSPLYSVKSFESLHLKEELLKGIYGLGFVAPSKIQETALPILLANPPQNMVAQSQSGTGKTAAFVLTMLSRIDTSEMHIQALCVCPTYELAIQIGEVVCKMGVYIPNLTIKYAVRGEEADQSITTSHIIIGTPGKMQDWTTRAKYIDLKKVKVFILDEADIMINIQGYQDQSIRMMKKLSSSCQIMLFSATYEQPLIEFAESVIPNPVVIKLRREEESLDNIKQFWVMCPTKDEKYEAIVNLYSTLTVGQAMIFCQTKKTAEWLAQQMEKDGHAVAMLTGDLTVEQRISVFDRFRDNKHKCLITTNVLARGIDIETVSLVINFDIPVTKMGAPDFDTYLHRIGRTGRFGKDGIAINVVETENDTRKLHAIEEHFGITIKRLNVKDLDEIENETKW